LQQVFQSLRIIQTWHLDQNPVLAFALNCRLGCAQLVDTAADHFDGLVHRLRQARIYTVLGEGQARQPISGNSPPLRPGFAHQTTRVGWCRQPFQHVLGIVQTIKITDPKLHRLAL
jgi:hypothetical protein